MAEKKTIESPMLKYPFVGANGTYVANVMAAVRAVNIPYKATVFGEANFAPFGGSSSGPLSPSEITGELIVPST
jgi:hypothetical protein